MSPTDDVEAVGPYDWWTPATAGGSYRDGLGRIQAAAALPVETFQPVSVHPDEDEYEAAWRVSNIAALDRVLLAAGELANGLGMCTPCFAAVARRAHFMASDFSQDSDDLEVARIAESEARSCDCWFCLERAGWFAMVRVAPPTSGFDADSAQDRAKVRASTVIPIDARRRATAEPSTDRPRSDVHDE